MYHTNNKPTAADVGALGLTAKANNSALLDGKLPRSTGAGTTGAVAPNTIALRDATSDVFARLFRTEYTGVETEANIGFVLTQREQGAGTAKDNYMRPTSLVEFKKGLQIEFVDNTSDATKQAATLAAATKSDVGLGNVQNTTDLQKVISTLTQVALDDIEALALAGL